VSCVGLISHDPFPLQGCPLRPRNSLLLLAGTAAAVVWANVDSDSYDSIAHPLHFLVNDIGMVFFFALAAKEVFEATLPGGPLASPRRALSPLAAAVGGMAAPALIYVALALTRGSAELTRGGLSGRDGHRVFSDGRAARVSRLPPRDSVPPVAGDRRRRDRLGDARGVLPPQDRSRRSGLPDLCRPPSSPLGGCDTGARAASGPT